ncbi:MAG: ribosome biogenesis GTP-binding protein YihA/YsxC [Thermodesulfobacteriota bacterium]
MQLAQVSFLTSVHHLDQLPPADLPELAFAGRSNVGKSSLLNRLFGRRGLVIAGSRPGTTRALNFFVAPGVCGFVDLPGYGYAQVDQASRQRWRKLVEAYLAGRDNLVAVVLLVDLRRHPPSPLDLDLVAWLRSIGRSFLLVYTKADQVSGSRRQAQAQRLDTAFAVTPQDRILFSARSGQGREVLLARLVELLDQPRPAVPAP